MIRGHDRYTHHHGSAVQLVNDAYDPKGDRWRDDDEVNGPIGIVKDVFRQTDHSLRYLVHWPEPDPGPRTELLYGWKEIVPVDPPERSRWMSTGGITRTQKMPASAAAEIEKLPDNPFDPSYEYRWLLDHES